VRNFRPLVFRCALRDALLSRDGRYICQLPASTFLRRCLARVKKIDEVYGRWSNTPEEENLDLERFFAAVIALPRAAHSSEYFAHTKSGQNALRAIAKSARI
jgi:hypothetical protein